MAAYLIALRERTKDPIEMAKYAEAAKSVDFSKCKGLVGYGKLETLEGEAFEGVVMMEFPTFEEAQKWYHSPEYTAARQHRLKGADYRFMIVQGM